jgi:hypothetical protein
MNMRVVATGQDAYWLAAVQQATAEWTGDAHTLKCPGELLKCISNLPEPDAETVLLVDASGQRDIEQVVAGLRDRGWTYIVVVAADPSAKEATAVLRRNLGYDYWEKTYEEDKIHNKIEGCFDEINKKKKSMSKKPHSFE